MCGRGVGLLVTDVSEGGSLVPTAAERQDLDAADAGGRLCVPLRRGGRLDSLLRVSRFRPGKQCALVF